MPAAIENRRMRLVLCPLSSFYFSLSTFYFACIVANMTASTVAQYLAALPADRRAALSAVREAINENLPACSVK